VTTRCVAPTLTWARFASASSARWPTSRSSTLVERLRQRIGALVVGDPAAEETDVGAMISEERAVRAEAWINETWAA
jgi:acyl-CoA reductase-like NAD-dependent aldehyde dehydrogenase